MSIFSIGLATDLRVYYIIPFQKSKRNFDDFFKTRKIANAEHFM